MPMNQNRNSMISESNPLFKYKTLYGNHSPTPSSDKAISEREAEHMKDTESSHEKPNIAKPQTANED